MSADLCPPTAATKRKPRLSRAKAIAATGIQSTEKRAATTCPRKNQNMHGIDFPMLDLQKQYKMPSDGEVSGHLFAAR